MDPAALAQEFPALGRGSAAVDPILDEFGRARDGSPTIAAGTALDLPPYLVRPRTWDIGLGPWQAGEARPEAGLVLSIAGSPASVAPGERVRLKAVLTNESPRPQGGPPVPRDLILTFHFRYRGGHFDKQELYRVRVRLPDRLLEPGESLDLTALAGWADPVNGRLGDPFHLRTDTRDWKQGCRLRATARFVGRDEATATALQRLEDLLYSKEVLKVDLQ
jgi:hypothetical protein